MKTIEFEAKIDSVGAVLTTGLGASGEVTHFCLTGDDLPVIGASDQWYRVTLEEVELKPCPFCGGEGWIAKIAKECFYARCLDCGVRFPTRVVRSEAVEEWNKRNDD